ncbi:n-acetyltransferase domain-containing protein [Trichonephila inaurata madagascariensis]|uniref:N-acetyltransferase domain-containing protein n=2 Tax=Trichonephila inaurata madagascariensis TaxID=2747483 RepID=A0A8X7CNV2_9ARAC|nr:n-acetyltransferase domain-containing protein [Trichonephila inaurata madagascariensis]
MNQLKALKFRLRPFVEADIPAVVKMALRCTYQFSTDDLKSWSKHDPTGIKVAELDSGEVIGLGACLNHNDNISFVGAFIVDEKYRSMKVFPQLMMAAVQHSGHRNIGGNGYASKVGFLGKVGFKEFEKSWTVKEYEYLGELRTNLLSDRLPEGVEIRSLEQNSFESMLLYDRTLVGYDRKFIFKSRSREKNSKTLIALKDGTCIGYGVVKRNILDAALVGPLYADDVRVAEVMLRKLLESMPNAKGLSMATISTNLAINEIVQRMGISVYNNLLRLYTKEHMRINTSKIFAFFDVDFSPF